MKLKYIICYSILLICVALSSQPIYIGIYISELDRNNLKKHDLTGGVKIDSVMTDSPAQKAGLRKNQIIFKIDNHRINNEKDFQRVISTYQPKSKILFTVKSNKKTKVYSINSANRNSIIKDLYLYNYIQNPWLFIGIDVQAMNPQLSQYFNVRNGLLIVDIREHSIASKNNFQVGDIITKVNNVRVNNENELTRQLAWGLKNQPIMIDVIRKHNAHRIALDLTNKKGKKMNINKGDVYLIGPDIYDNELYKYSQDKINKILNQSDTEITTEIERLENDIQTLKKKIKKKK